jgi:hypothetical protein
MFAVATALLRPYATRGRHARPRVRGTKALAYALTAALTGLGVFAVVGLSVPPVFLVVPVAVVVVFVPATRTVRTAASRVDRIFAEELD